MGWFSDFLRLAWGLFYWNTRKTVYRLRGTRGPCPCQHPSDSGRAWETGCVAVTDWKSPERFRRLCPLLRQNANGQWRCSANQRDVRPFWGRAFAFYGMTLLAVYLATTLAAFVALKAIGYKVTYPGVLWPPAWEKFAVIRSNYFLDKFRVATEAGDRQAALLSLSTAYNLDPSNYSAGRQLARLWQVSQPGFSNRVYNRLLIEHPAEADATAQAWFRALLAGGDFIGIEQLAINRILAAPERSGAWINAFLFANRRTGNADAVAELKTARNLPAPARFLLTLAEDLARAPADHARERLLRAAAEAGDPLSFFNVCRQLIARGFAQDALESLDRRGGLLGARDTAPLRLDAFAALGWRASLLSEVEGLLAAPPEPVVVELLSAHLIRYPDAAVRERVFARLEQRMLPASEGSYSAMLALFCAAGANGDGPRLRWTAERINELLGADFRSLPPIGESLLDGNRNRRIENYLPALQPLPLEVSYALFDHYAPVRR